MLKVNRLIMEVSKRDCSTSLVLCDLFAKIVIIITFVLGSQYFPQKGILVPQHFRYILRWNYFSRCRPTLGRNQDPLHNHCLPCWCLHLYVGRLYRHEDCNLHKC